MKTTKLCGALLTLLMLWGGSADLLAQDNRWFGETGNWTDSADWEFFSLPNPGIEPRAIIGTPDGNPSDPATLFGEVNVNTDLTGSPSPTLVVGLGGGGEGILNIQSGGTLNVVDTTGDDPAGPSTGIMEIGSFGAEGTVNIFGGGTLNVANGLFMFDNENVQATLSLDGTTGSVASLSANSATLDRTLEVKGSNVDFSVTNNLILGLAGTHTWQIPASGASTISVGGNADLGGTLRLEFPDGTPAVGSTWNLIDAAEVDANEAAPSSFTNVDTSAVPGLGQAQNFRVQSVQSGAATNGTFAQLVLEQHPILRVNRDTGVVTLENPGNVDSVAMDVYVVSSDSGGLNPANFSSIAPADGWAVANAKTTALSELNGGGTASVAANTQLNLGEVFNPVAPAVFGEENEDVRFRFSVPGAAFIEAEVIYEGIPNNTLTLNVDPATGDAQIVNGTSFTVAIDTYSVRSASSSLQAGDANWNSLEDQGESGGNWFEANSGTGATDLISELLVDGGLTLAPNAVIDLGSPFDTSGEEDLVFQFAILGSSDGDFNNDGIVNLADYTVWRDNLGAADDSALSNNGDGSPGVTAADYTVWKNNFGQTAVVGDPEFLTGKVVYSSFGGEGAASLEFGTAVPEPSTGLLVLLGLAGVAMCRARQNQ